MSRVLVIDPIHPKGIELLKQAGAEVRLLSSEERESLAAMIPEFDALIVRGMTQVGRSLLAAGSRLQVVGRAGAGVDNIDTGAATELGIQVVNAPTANLVAAVEHTFALILALVRNIPAADRAIKEGSWDRSRFQGTELLGKTLGIVGLGRIGREVARRARAFEMSVAAHDPLVEPEEVRRMGVEVLPMEELLERADIVSLHLPLNDLTENIMDAKRVEWMKVGAYFVNCGRGGLVDEAALLAGLEKGRLAGAALDVFAQEPPGNLDLIRHPRVVATPHIGAKTREAQERVSTEIARGVLGALADQSRMPGDE